MALTCTNCQAHLPNDSKFCAECGTQVAAPEEKPAPRFCLQCGVRLLENAKFCLVCGTRVTTDAKRVHEKIDQAIVQEIFKNPYPPDEYGRPVIVDFEEIRFEIKKRVEQYAEYFASLMSAPEWFNTLCSVGLGSVRYLFYYLDIQQSFRTNKPNAQEALISKTLIEWFTREAKNREYIDYEGKFAPKVLAFINQGENWSDEELQALRIERTYAELEELAKKDDELFPPPQPIRVEVAGAVLNFTTNESALVVYADSSHKGERIWIRDSREGLIIGQLVEEDRREAEIMGRSVDNTEVCAAIFNHIPFVNNVIRYFQKVIHRVDFTMKPHPSARFEDRREEIITVFRGTVAELDWRGRK